jgi:hypothetical protein
MRILRLHRLKLATLVVIGVALITVQLSSINAAVRGTLNFRLSCTGFTSMGGRLILNRDNTGSNQEAYMVTGMDGTGNIIYGPNAETFVVGGQLIFPNGQYESWTSVPQANPLFLIVASSAGNDHAEEVIYRRTDNCSSLPVSSSTGFDQTGLNEVPRIVDAQTAPSVPLNAAPPVPISINNIANLLELPGYAIVNTSRLNMRSGSGTQFTRVAVLNGGTELVVLGRNANDSWWYVLVDGMRGWVSGEYLILRGDLRALPVLPSQGDILPPRFILYDDYPVWNGPSQTARRICTLPGNLEYAILGRDRDSEWYQVDATCDGEPVIGWVQAGLGAVRNSGGLRIPVTS